MAMVTLLYHRCLLLQFFIRPFPFTIPPRLCTLDSFHHSIYPPLFNSLPLVPSNICFSPTFKSPKPDSNIKAATTSTPPVDPQIMPAANPKSTPVAQENPRSTPQKEQAIKSTRHTMTPKPLWNQNIKRADRR